MKFYPPNQLPPMNQPSESAEEPHQPQPRSLKQRFALMIAAFVVGVTAAGVGFHLSGNAVWFAAVPVALAIGWFLAVGTFTSVAGPGGSGGGPVLW
jgi:hypothetical protein